MIKAIHKETGQLVSAIRLERDTSWTRTSGDIWLAPYASLEKKELKKLKEEGIEPEVLFIKSHQRENLVNKKFVTPHFRAKNERIGRAIKPESEEHKLAKEGILEECYNNNIIIEDNRIRDRFVMNSLDIEERLGLNKKTKIADVLYFFKNYDERFGRGIVFEIQFSDQNEELTEERTYDRVLEGFSVVWLWEGDFDENYNLKNKEVKVIPFQKAIGEYRERNKNKYEEEIEKISLNLDNKYILLENTQNKINKSIQDNKEKLEIELSEKIKKIFSNQELENEKKAKEILERVDNSFKEKISQEQIKEMINEKVKDIKQDKIIEEIKKDIIKRILDEVRSNKEIDNLKLTTSECWRCGKKLTKEETLNYQLSFGIEGPLHSYCYPCYNIIKNSDAYKNGENKTN